MGESGERKRSKKKSKRSRRDKAAARSRLSKNAPEGAAPETVSSNEPSGGETYLSATNQELVIELQKTELSRLLREQQRLNERIDQLLQLHEREQVLRQQMQASLDSLTAQRHLPTPNTDETNQAQLIARVNSAEGKFSALQSAVILLVAALERQRASA